MKSHYRVVFIDGGDVGASVLHHLARLDRTEVCPIEPSALMAGSSWHAAGEFHALNADPQGRAMRAA